MNPLLPDVIGSGAADIFVGGQYVAGAWSRESLTERTVFYDQQGNELALQRGKSWIIICDVDTEVVIGDIDTSMQNNLYSDVSENEDGERLAIADVSDNKDSEPLAVPNANQAESQSEQKSADSTEQPVESALDSQFESNFATIKVPNKGPLNMRVKNSGKSDIIARIPNGSSVEVIEREDEWTKIKYDGNIGYVMTNYLMFSK